MQESIPQRVLAILLLGSTQLASAAELGELETQDFRLLYFDTTQTYLTPHVTIGFHNSLERQRSIFGYDPDERTTVLLKDFSDYANAAAGAIPRNTVQVDVSPMSFAFETMPVGERMTTIMNHELVHVAMMDQPNSSDRRYRRFFGGKVSPVSEHPETMFYSYLTNPRVWTPGWFLEGSATFLETWLSGGLGRALGAYDEMVFRAMVRDGAHFYDPLGLVAEGTKVDFQVGINSYLYGTRFMSYLAYTYTPEMLIQWIGRHDGSERNYRSQFQKVFGIRLVDAWQNWIDWEHEFQTNNLESVRQYEITHHEDITDQSLGSISRAYFDPESRTLYAAFRYPGVVAHIGALSVDDGSIEKIVDIKGPMIFRVSSLAYDADSNTIYYTTDNYAHRDLVSLDIRTGKTRILQKDARIGELVYNKADNSIWGVRHLNGLATLVRIPYPYDEWNQIHTFDYGQVLYDLDISPDGKLVSTSMGQVDGGQSVRVMNTEALLTGDTTPVAEFDVGRAVPEGFVFSTDGRFLYGSSYYTGVSNIWRYELDSERLEIVSNTETGFFRPIPLADGSLIVLRYTGTGFIPTIIDPKPLEDVNPITFLGQQVVVKHPQIGEWQVRAPNEVSLDELVESEGHYTPIANLGLESFYPIVEGYKDSYALGLNVSFSDPIMFDTLNIKASYSLDSDLPSNELMHASIDYRHVVADATALSGVWSVGFRHNYADFYDLAGPTERSRKGNRFSVGYEKSLIYDEPRLLDLSAELNHYTNLDSLPRYQNVPASLDELSTLSVDLNYSNRRRSLGAVDYEKGFNWRLATTVDHVDGDTIPKVVAGFDFGLALPWKHSSIWLRNSAGAAFGEPDDEFANFFFGGFGNNYVDRGSIKRYREFYAMPGFELNQVPGRNFHRAMLEWNLPPIRFKRVGTPGFYLSWARPAVFVSALTTNLDDASIRQEVQSAGVQIDFRFTVLSRMNMTLSFGYAEGFGGDTVADDNEFMVSLKIL
ncbi:MAG: hypothetical protein OEM50_03195 [Gammaproteobacteria bacterium]|nr:hypothetical protein [Gammaproteobacteria bacterium]MDH3480695.1 hypothetical protein [Gammaproteobacteria bacterium]